MKKKEWRRKNHEIEERLAMRDSAFFIFSYPADRSSLFYFFIGGTLKLRVVRAKKVRGVKDKERWPHGRSQASLPQETGATEKKKKTV